MLLVPVSDRNGAGLGWWPFGRGTMLRCPNGHAALLDHEIAADGTVTPSVDCGLCEFHTYVRLAGWKGGE